MKSAVSEYFKFSANQVSSSQQEVRSQQIEVGSQLFCCERWQRSSVSNFITLTGSINTWKYFKIFHHFGIGEPVRPPMKWVETATWNFECIVRAIG